MRVLVTGGAGYIGSLAVWRLLALGYTVTVVDSLIVGSLAAVQRAGELAGRAADLVQADIRDTDRLIRLVRETQPQAVLHFAGLKSVAESVAFPERYYDNNVQGSLSLLRALQGSTVRRIIFSSSATVYGQAAQAPFAETSPIEPVNPYGRSKWMVEMMLRDFCAADPMLGAVALRYFNPVGAHPSGRLGEWVTGAPNNLLPYIIGVVQGRFERVRVFGGDYPTPDGSGVRDYIHVLDLVEGHCAALRAGTGFSVYNLGTGVGYSVHDMIRAMQAVCARTIPHEVVERRPGDVAVSIADPTRARQCLGWQAQYDLMAMCRDAWRFAENNPMGYASAGSAAN